MVFMLCLTGCSEDDRNLRSAMQLREQILSAQSCAFLANITADYGDNLHTFSMDCRTLADGVLQFEIMKPETIAGITGNISEEGGNITFDERSLFFPLLTDDLLIPASAPWIMMKTLRGGYITAVCEEDDLLHMTIQDSYAEDALMVDIWINDRKIPVRADILHEGKRILTVDVENFSIS